MPGWVDGLGCFHTPACAPSWPHLWIIMSQSVTLLWLQQELRRRSTRRREGKGVGGNPNKASIWNENKIKLCSPVLSYYLADFFFYRFLAYLSKSRKCSLVWQHACLSVCPSVDPHMWTLWGRTRGFPWNAGRRENAELSQSIPPVCGNFPQLVLGGIV